MKKVIVGLLLLVLLIPTVAFAGNRTSAAEVFESIVGTEPMAGTPLRDQAEAAGKGEAFFQAMQAEKDRSIQQLLEDGVLTTEEADFLRQRMEQTTYGDQQMMRQIPQKLRDADLSPQGPKGQMRRQTNAQTDCPQADPQGPGPFGTGDCTGQGGLGRQGRR